MKEKFLALVEEVKNTGIVEALYKTSNAEELTAAWQKFSAENQELIAKIKEWATEYEDSDTKAIFEDGEQIADPMEIAVCIKIIENSWVSEEEIFCNWEDLAKKIADIESDFAAAVAKLMYDNLICEITAEDIFDSDSDEDAAEDSEN